jgi:hypothetical protein
MRLGDDQVQRLDTEREPRPLTRVAVAFANSDAPEDHDVLVRKLQSTAFLERIDEPEHYEGTFSDLRLGRVLHALTRNPSPSARQAIVRLTAAGPFQQHVFRIQLLIRALAAVRPSPPDAIEYWDRVSAPGSPVAFDVIQALCENQSAPAMQLFESKLAEPRHDFHERVDWLRSIVLPRRRDLPVLTSCARLLNGPMEAALKPRVVETLFQYKPDSWYVLCEPPKPPGDVALPDAVSTLLERIARYSLEHVELDPGLRIAVESRLEAFD